MTDGEMCLYRAQLDQRHLGTLCFWLSILHALPCDTISVMLPSCLAICISSICFPSLLICLS